MYVARAPGPGRSVTDQRQGSPEGALYGPVVAARLKEAHDGLNTHTVGVGAGVGKHRTFCSNYPKLL